MAWQRQGSIRGPQGAKGDQGDPGTTGPAGHDGAAGPKGDQGDAGTPGAGLHLQGTETAANLNGKTLGTGDAGKGWLLGDAGTVGGHAMSKGHMVVWDGTIWHDAGEIVGPPGPKGTTGDAGTTGPAGQPGGKGDTGARGSKWFIGAGAPTSQSGEMLGDLYLDTGTGDVYQLEA